MFEPNPPVTLTIPQQRAALVSEWLYEYQRMFGPLAESHPVEIMLDAFRDTYSKVRSTE